MADFGQVLLVEEAELERAAVGHELFDGGGAQRGDPPVGVLRSGPVFPLVQGRDPGGGDHAAVAGHDHLLQAELVPHHVHDGGEGGRVAGVAGEDPDCGRAAFGVGEQPVLDLQLAFLAVAGVAAGGQRAVAAFQPRAGQVEQGHPRRIRLRAQVAGGQLRLDLVLPPGQPVHRRIHLIGGGRGDAQVGAEGGVSPPGQRGQPGRRGHHPGDHQRQRQVPLGAGGAQQRRQAQLHRHRVHRGDVPVRHRGGDRHRMPGRHQPLALQGSLDRIDRLPRQRRQVRQRLMPDLAAIAVGTADQHRLIHPLLTGLRHVRPPVPGYVHRTATCHHNPDRSTQDPPRAGSTHTISWLHQTAWSDGFQHLKTAISTESYSNSGLVRQARAARSHLAGFTYLARQDTPAGSLWVSPARCCW